MSPPEKGQPLREFICTKLGRNCKFFPLAIAFEMEKEWQVLASRGSLNVALRPIVLGGGIMVVENKFKTKGPARFKKTEWMIHCEAQRVKNASIALRNPSC